MSISIVTPHYNNFDGLKHLYADLKSQTSSDWNWIIVDDCSDANVIKSISNWQEDLEDNRLELILVNRKTNASICRNRGAAIAKHERIIFLDSDDHIADTFVNSRIKDFGEFDFVVFENYAVVSTKGSVEVKKKISTNYLDCFLGARFIWQTTSILWNKKFFNAIGQFHPQLPRLQDVELSIRALQKSDNHKSINIPFDFYYHVKPIRERKDFVKPVCDAVYLFISELLDTSELSKKQIKLTRGYYYQCTRYLERSGSVADIGLVRANLSLFRNKGYIDNTDYLSGLLVLKLYSMNLISPSFFLALNRKLFKPQYNIHNR